MQISDLDGMSLDEIQQALIVLSERHQFLASQQRDEAVVARAQLADAITSMEVLLGPAEGNANTDSIRGVLRFSDADMAQNAGLALRLAFLGLEQLAKATIDAAKVIAT